MVFPLISPFQRCSGLGVYCILWLLFDHIVGTIFYAILRLIKF
jgi:hypothetical protein